MPTPAPTLPAPRTWSADDLITTPRLRADVSGAVAFLTQKPLFAGQNNTGASIPNSTDTTLGLQVELVDNWNGHVTVASGSATPHQYFAPVPGWYLCRSRTGFAAFSGTAQAAQAGGFSWTVGGASQPVSRGAIQAVNSGANLLAQCCDLIEQTASGPVGGSGDFIQPTVFQGSGSPLALATGGLEPAVSIRWVCATSGTQPLPVPPLAAVSSPITSAWLNANVRDAIRFLAYPPVFKGIYTGSGSLASSVFPAANLVPIGTAVVDNYGGFSAGASKWTAPVPGRYFVYGHWNLAAAGVSTGYYAGVSVNGGTTQWGDGSFNANSSVSLSAGASVTSYLRLSAGDTVQLMACQGSGGSVAYSTVAANQSRLIVIWAGI